MDIVINESIWMDRFISSVYVVYVVIRVWSRGGKMSADAIKLSNCGPYPAAPKVTTLTLVAGADPWNLAPECLSVLVISSLSSCCLCSASSRSILDESSPAASEIAGPETGGLWVIRPKERQVRSRKLTEQMSRLENAGPQNAGLEIMSMKWA